MATTTLCRVDLAIVSDSFGTTDLEQRFKALALKTGAVGAVVTFMGQVRQLGDRPDVTGLILEHYAGMTERVLRQHIASACERWDLLGIVVVHRVGKMHLDDNIVGVLVASAHRQAAFEAVQYLMDFLKHDAPFWKQELTDQGAEWVEQKATDLAKVKDWSS